MRSRRRRSIALLAFGCSAVSAFQPHFVEEISVATLQPHTQAVDCTAHVKAPIDVAPIRSPQAIHSYIASRIAGKRIVEIGTRNGDGMMCFSQVAANATAVEYDKPYCDRLRVRARGSFHVHCADYRKGLPAADFYTWWQQEPDLADSALLAFLRREAAAGQVPPGAQAIPIFDLSCEWAAGRSRTLSWLRPRPFYMSLPPELTHCFAGPNTHLRRGGGHAQLADAPVAELLAQTDQL